MTEPNQIQALHKAGQYLRSNEDDRKNFENRLHLAVFQNELYVQDGLWKTNPSREMTCIQLFGYWYFLNNIKVAMTKEMLGLGP